MRRYDRPLLSNGSKFAIVFCVVNLHILRNVSEVGYLAVYVPVTVYTFIRYFAQSRQGVLADRGRLFDLWLMTGVFGYFVSLSVISPAGAATGLTRFLFASPVFMALALYTKGVRDLVIHMRTMVVFFGLASLTLPLQFFTGPISWFADASSRAGFDRYASLLGSMTSLGIIVGSYLILVQVLPGGRKYAWLFVIGLSALLSLSKAAIANAAIATCLIAYLNRRSIVRLLGLVIAAVSTIFVILRSVPSISDRLAATLLSFGIGAENSGIVNYDYSVNSSAWDRVTALPLANLNALGDLHSSLVYAVGGGFGMGNTGLVSAADVTAPMAHNQFVECLSVFGVLGGGVQLVILVVIAVRLYRRYVRTHERVVLIAQLAYGLFLANSVFANGTVYQPASASIFFLSLFIATSEAVVRAAPPSESVDLKG